MSRWKPHPPRRPIQCCDCSFDGWGPMLRDVVWSGIGYIKPILEKGYPRYWLCEDCMVRRLGRALTAYDLRDCPMNYGHTAYKPHGHSHD